MLTNIEKAQAHIIKLIPDVVFLKSINNGIVTFLLNHPKRVLTPSSFVNKAKKLGLNASGTRSATGPTLVVGYITMDAFTELMIRGGNEGNMLVEVRIKQ